MIQKVNRPPFLSLVAAAKSPENDPGGSQGSGVSYEGPPGEPSPPKAQTDSGGIESEHSAKAPQLSLVVAIDQIGLTEVVRDFHENKKEKEPFAGLTSRYSSDSGPAKGLLLNKKVE